MSETRISWTTFTWNPTRGCSVVSPGCTNCYAMNTASRFSGPGKPFEGYARKVNGHPVWTGRVDLIEARLAEPLAWQRRVERTNERIHVFVDSMSDLFHEELTEAEIDRVIAVIERCPNVVFQVLTKRPLRMVQHMNSYPRRHQRSLWPLPNLWLGVSVEDQTRAQERIPLLLRTRAAVRFLSCEPLLGPIDLERFLYREVYSDDGQGDRDVDLVPRGELHWVIAGGESGRRRREMDLDWPRFIRDQCREAGVAFFFKQKSHLRSEWDPTLDGLQWRQMPDVPYHDQPPVPAHELCVEAIP